ncbi:hypothetical protein SDC9_157573 [bioreactor metagenome]|uniref:Uncharacterized protein n=1 Tax=bioreactor metagenome TaxID=1076179 RepID=A0A645F7D2_9ZZZZ|nr:hypothetical protein [Rikenellaceae bacterium]
MKENIEAKKEWSQPECYDLDVDKTASAGDAGSKEDSAEHPS